MPDTTLLTILLNSGVAGVFLILFLIGLIVPKSVLDDKNKAFDKLQIAYDLERQRADTYQQAALTNLEVLKALQGVAYDNRRQTWEPPQLPSSPPPESPEVIR